MTCYRFAAERDNFIACATYLVKLVVVMFFVGGVVGVLVKMCMVLLDWLKIIM